MPTSKELTQGPKRRDTVKEMPMNTTLKNAEFCYVVQWIIDEKDVRVLGKLTAGEIADLVVEARDAWDGGAR